MENKSHALAAGIFVLVIAAMLAGLAVWLTRDNANYEQYELSTRDGVSGLQPQAAVRYKGVAVGKVTRIGFDPQVNGNVLIRIAVNEQAPISPTTFAVLGYQGVTGLAHVLLDDAEQPYPELPPGPSGLPRLPLHPRDPHHLLVRDAVVVKHRITRLHRPQEIPGLIIPHPRPRRPTILHEGRPRVRLRLLLHQPVLLCHARTMNPDCLQRKPAPGTGRIPLIRGQQRPRCPRHRNTSCGVATSPLPLHAVPQESAPTLWHTTTSCGRVDAL